MFNNWGNVTTSDIQLNDINSLATSEDSRDLFAKVCAGIFSLYTFEYLVENGQNILNTCVTLTSKLFSQAEEPYSLKIDSKEKIIALLAKGSLKTLLESTYDPDDIFNVITDSDVLFTQENKRLLTFSTILNAATPENIELLMFTLSSKYFEVKMVSVGDFMQLLNGLNEEQARSFTKGVIDSGSSTILLENGPALADFLDIFLNLDEFKRGLVLDTLVTARPQNEKDVSLDTSKVANTTEQIQALLSSSDIPTEFSKLLLKSLSVENFATYTLALESRNLMTQPIMSLLAPYILEKSGRGDASSNAEQLLPKLLPESRTYFINTANSFLPMIKNKGDIANFFCNLLPDEQRMLFFKMRHHIEDIIASSENVRDTLDYLKQYLTTDIFTLVENKLAPLSTVEPASLQTQPQYPTESLISFFERCRSQEFCAVILNELIKERTSNDFPYIFAEQELTKYLATRLTYAINATTTTELLKILTAYDKNEIYNTGTWPLSRVISGLNPLQIVSFITPLAIALLNAGELDNTRVRLLTSAYMGLNKEKVHALFYSLKDIAKPIISECVEVGDLDQGCGVSPRCDIVTTLTSLRQSARQKYFDIFVAPNIDILFNTPRKRTNSSITDSRQDSLIYRLSVLFSLIDPSQLPILFMGVDILSDRVQLNRLRSTAFEYFSAQYMLNYGPSWDQVIWDLGTPSNSTRYTPTAGIERQAMLNLAIDMIARRVTSISELEDLSYYFDDSQFEMICEKIKEIDPDRFTLSEALSFNKNRLYRDNAIKIFGNRDCHHQNGTDSQETLTLQQIQEKMPKSDRTVTFFKAVESGEIDSIQASFSRLSDRKPNATFFSEQPFDMPKLVTLLRKLPNDEYYALFKAAGVNVYEQSSSPCL